MENIWLNHWKSNNWIPYCCTSCVKWTPEWSIYWIIRCDKWTLMDPNEYCKDFTLDESIKDPEEVINIVKIFIQKNSWN